MNGVKVAMDAVANQHSTMADERSDAAKRIAALKAEMTRRAKEWDVT